ncbi:TOTE conflict system archaeo-eukaryotic primase domain-containing protein [Desulfatibacillum alkenivorans]|uniref:TOTE conflict system archaeo-eukaryotic primase domain-containing protein n=1 Tax=Desulfatibacillum alkenivorans TaxID=259354 RepID=UPI001114DE66|nr:hypothetical protein [Desulfatibacillum alkenivorans]
MEIFDIDKAIAKAESELAKLEAKRNKVLEKLNQLNLLKDSCKPSASEIFPASAVLEITKHSPEADKIALFLSLFRGRTDVYPRRFESSRTGKSGYQPACRNESHLSKIGFLNNGE